MRPPPSSRPRPRRRRCPFSDRKTMPASGRPLPATVQSPWRLLIATRRRMWRGRNRMCCRRSSPMRRCIQSRGLGWRCGRKRLSLGGHGRDGMRCRRGGRMQRRIGSCGLGRRYGRNWLNFGIRRFGLGSATRGVFLAGRPGFSKRFSAGRICPRRRGARLYFSRRYNTFASELAGLGRRGRMRRDD